MRAPLVLLLAVAACGGPSAHKATSSSTTPTNQEQLRMQQTEDVPAGQSDETPPPNGGKVTPKVMENAMRCPSQDAAAMKAYSEGYAATQDGDAAGAETAYLQAIALDKNFCDAYDNLGLLYRHTDRIDDAIKMYRASIAVAPDDPEAHMDLAVALRLQGDLAGAESEYQVLIKLDPNDPEGYFGLGQTQLTGNQAHAAIPTLEKALALYQAQGSDLADDARTMLGIAYAMDRRWSDARDALEAVYPRYGGDPSVNLYLGEAYIHLADLKKAREYLERAKTAGAPVPQSDWDAIGGE